VFVNLHDIHPLPAPRQRPYLAALYIVLLGMSNERPSPGEARSEGGLRPPCQPAGARSPPTGCLCISPPLRLCYTGPCLTLREPRAMVSETWKRNVTLFLASHVVSFFGSSLVAYAIMWHITLTTQSGSMMTISILCNFLPSLLLAPFAGVWADRYNRKLLIAGA